MSRELWDSGIHDARILAYIIDEPGKVTEEKMERWTGSDAWKELTSEKVRKRLAAL